MFLPGRTILATNIFCLEKTQALFCLFVCLFVFVSFVIFFVCVCFFLLGGEVGAKGS